MSKVDVKEYITLHMQHEESDDTAVKEMIKEEMFRLWYYYMNLDEKKQIEQAIGKQKFYEE